jgi:ubiquinone/menaquinone biosynthesis C-methylase UbiE
LSVEEPDAAARVRIDEGIAEKLTDPSGSVDLIWCRDVLVHVKDLETVFGEFPRVLKPSGRALIPTGASEPTVTAASESSTPRHKVGSG